MNTTEEIAFDPADIPAICQFNAVEADQGNVIYYEYGSNIYGVKTAFADCGRQIKVFDESESSILASMQLGVANWDKIKISGDAEFQQRCFEIALQNGIRVENDEFQSVPKANKNVAACSLAEHSNLSTDFSLVAVST